MALTRAKLEELIAAGEIEVGGGGGLSNPMPDTTLIANLNADLLDGVHLADIRLGQNILHNADFRNSVNQRGVSGAISTGAYFLDRWIRNSGTVTVAAGYLTLASGAVIEQRIEGNLLAGLICTVSFEVGGTIYHGSGAFPASNGTVPVEVDGYPNITFGCATGYMFVLIPATSNTSIKRFKCEMGFVSTLHLDPPMDYGTELAKCQRYAVALGAAVYLCRASHVWSTARYFFIPLPVMMRISPSLASGALGIYKISDNSAVTGGSGAFTVYGSGIKYIYTRASAEDCTLYSNAAILSADL